jgi:hypothetical protein
VDPGRPRGGTPPPSSSECPGPGKVDRRLSAMSAIGSEYSNGSKWRRNPPGEAAFNSPFRTSRLARRGCLDCAEVATQACSAPASSDFRALSVLACHQNSGRSVRGRDASSASTRTDIGGADRRHIDQAWPGVVWAVLVFLRQGHCSDLKQRCSRRQPAGVLPYCRLNARSNVLRSRNPTAAAMLDIGRRWYLGSARCVRMRVLIMSSSTARGRPRVVRRG